MSNPGPPPASSFSEKRQLATGLQKDGPHKRARNSKEGQDATPRGKFHDLFEKFRDELDEHYDRKERIIKVSRDVTAHSKKIIFALQRVNLPNTPFPPSIQKDINNHLSQIATLLTSISPDLTPLNRHRYAWSLRCLEELAEALSFSHYLQHQTLITQPEMQRLVPGEGHVALLWGDYLNGIFDLFGEMMRFATVSSARHGILVGGDDGNGNDEEEQGKEDQDQDPEKKTRRNILQDMQELGCAIEMLPEIPTKDFRSKRDVMRQSVVKVEKLGYGLVVRGTERPKGWVPDMKEDVAAAPESP